MKDNSENKLIDQLKAAQQLKKLPLAKMVSIFESTLQKHSDQRQHINAYINKHPEQFNKRAKIIGFTGTPGAGKSSLISALSQTLINQNNNISIAVLAVDPSSQVSGGSILGDRTRMRLGQKQPRLFFRSQASKLELGGVTESTFQACRILRYLFDYIIIETVGIGQNEIDIQYLTDHTYLVMQPLAGDQIQFMKCGIMEVPDSFVVNKCDEEKLARTSYHMLRTALKQAKIIDLHANDDYTKAPKENIFLTSATNGKGINELASHFLQIQSSKPFIDSELFYLKKHIQKLYGVFGLSFVDHLIDQDKTQDFYKYDYERKESYAVNFIEEHITR